MKTITLNLAVLVLAGNLHATVITTAPMVTGIGNVTSRPAHSVVTNQTSSEAPTPESTMTLEKFVVTGSLLRQLPTADNSPEIKARSAPIRPLPAIAAIGANAEIHLH